MINDEEAIRIKQQILKYIENNFPEDKKDLAKRKIATMNNTQLEEFLKKNSEMNSSGNSSNPLRSIIDGKISYFEIENSEDALAVLEINPISLGHSIIIPKEQVTKEIPTKILKFAEKVSKKLKNKLEPKEVLIREKEVLGEMIIDLIPVYNDEDENSERLKIDEKELKIIQNKIIEKKTPEKKTVEEKTIEKIKKETNLWLPKRIP